MNKTSKPSRINTECTGIRLCKNLCGTVVFFFIILVFSVFTASVGVCADPGFALYTVSATCSDGSDVSLYSVCTREESYKTCISQTMSIGNKEDYLANKKYIRFYDLDKKNSINVMNMHVLAFSCIESIKKGQYVIVSVANYGNCDSCEEHIIIDTIKGKLIARSGDYISKKNKFWDVFEKMFVQDKETIKHGMSIFLDNIPWARLKDAKENQ
ncbi:MAG: hypothetical protein IPI58_01915 [Alphaproteobacteria bacterium]|nr:MAG: hypothetical protein IPI58_01915 [Alphaproteobacteria bacterium]